MSVTSPTSASPSASLLEWDEAAVQSYLEHIGLPQYEEVIMEHGITGDVLAMMDHASLQDLGIASIGHRLNLLRAVWELKREQGISMGEDDWRPQDVEEQDKKVQLAHVDRLWDLIVEQQERLINLERDHDRLITTLEKNGIQVAMQRLHEDGKARSAWKDFAGTHSDSEDTEMGHKVARRASKLFPASLASSTATHVAPLSSDSATFQDSFTPTTTSTSYPFDSPSHPPANGAKPTPIQATPLARVGSGSNLPPAPSSNPSVTLTRAPSNAKQQSQTLVRANTQNTNSVSPTPPKQVVMSTRESRARDEAASAAQSFRVTLDDPCWKVLPAALKKYKIDDDWRVYALFICFAETVERCLAFDEKPLILFQKLKESGQKPVFMLRHVRDIRSPISVAKQKQVAKLGLPSSTKEPVLPQLKRADDATISPTRAHGLGPAKRQEEGKTPGGEGFPELPSPGLATGDGLRSAERPPLVDENGNYMETTYAIAIYPYIADREDEFDVAVGMCYVVLNKQQKGWFIVQRDRRGDGDIGVPDPSKTGWVPAGCLIELNKPITVLTPSAASSPFPGLANVPCDAVLSSSFEGVALMKRDAKGDDEVSVYEGESVRVYKKYCHWSYAIRLETGERGWIPSWFIGKVNSDTPPFVPIPPSAYATTTLGTALITAKEDDGK